MFPSNAIKKRFLYIVFSILTIISHTPVVASDLSSFTISSGFLFFSSEEQTPEGSAKIEDKNVSLEMGYITKYKLYFGYKFIYNEKIVNIDSQIATAHGPSIGLIFPEYYFSLIITGLIDYNYTYLNYYDEEQQDGSFSRTKTNTIYTGKNAWAIDFNFIPGNGPIRLGPGFTYMVFSYNKLEFESTFIGNSAGSTTRDNNTTRSDLSLDNGTWKDSWIFPYIKLSMFF